MKKRVSKVTISMVFIVTFTALITAYLCRDSFYQENKKSRQDFAGTYSWGAAENNNMENMVYLAVMVTDENKNSTRYVAYYVSGENIIQEGECILSDNNYATFLDENGEVFARIVFNLGNYMLFDEDQEAKILEKISDGPVMPTNREQE